jgi:hypothetical protein
MPPPLGSASEPASHFAKSQLSLSQNAFPLPVDFLTRGISLLGTDQAEKISERKKSLKPIFMNRIFELVVFAAAVLLVFYGISLASASGLSHLLSPNPADKSIWLLWAGIASIVIGMVMSRRPGHN